VLQAAGLISRGREAQWRPCRLEPQALRTVGHWLERYRRFWEGAPSSCTCEKSEALLPTDPTARARAICWLFSALNTLGDLMMATVLRNLRHVNLVAAEPNLRAYLDRCEARPAFQRALRDQMASFAPEPA
jgi:hypothetical protein